MRAALATLAGDGRARRTPHRGARRHAASWAMRPPRCTPRWHADCVAAEVDAVFTVRTAMPPRSRRRCRRRLRGAHAARLADVAGGHCDRRGAARRRGDGQGLARQPHGADRRGPARRCGGAVRSQSGELSRRARCCSTSSSRWPSNSATCNLFRYLTFRTGGAVITALLISFADRAGRDPLAQAQQRQGQPIRTDGPETPPPDQEGHADHGRRADPARGHGLDPAVGGSCQRLCLGGADRHPRLRRCSASSTTTAS